MDTVVARFHHADRDLSRLEEALVAAGAQDAQITGYVVALNFAGGSHEHAAKAARKTLDRIGATGIRITKRSAETFVTPTA